MSGSRFPLCFPAALALAAAGVCAQPSAPQEKVSRAEDRSAVAVTIYNDDLALVREERTLPLNQGHNRIALREVSARISPETASLRALGGTPLHLLEQNFDFDLLTPAALLGKYVGKSVTVVRTRDDGTETRENAQVLANNSGVVLQYADRIETGLPANARMVYDALPANLRDRPTLVVDVQASEGGSRKTELSYLSSGFGWKADYVATLSKDEKTLDLAGWVTLTNRSGATYENARLQLVAGELNRVRESMRRRDDSVLYKETMMAVATAAPMAHEELFEYHLYSLQRPTTLRDNQTKQVALLSAASVPVRKEYRMQNANYWFHGLQAEAPERGEKRQIEVFMEFDNKDGDLGQPLPKGIVRVYKADSQGSALFIGEDQIDHTPKNEQVRLKLGKAFDVTGNWKQRHFERISRNTIEVEVEVELSNARAEPVTVRVVEPMSGNWSVLKESHKHSKPASTTAVWDIPVPADGKATLSYKARISW